MAANDLGYEEERFVTTISRNFHCLICLNVLKDPVMCRRNQHCFCRGCITMHLQMNRQRCPTCADELTVDTLCDAPRMVSDYLSELNIRCDFLERGCQEIVQLQNLERHVATCGFKPVICANQGCGATVSKRDRSHHESELCQHRKLQCHNCDEICKMMATVQSDVEKLKMNAATVNVRLVNMEKNVMTNVANMEKKISKLETGMANTSTGLLETMENNMSNLQTKIAKLERNSAKNFEIVNNEVKELKRTLTDVNDGYENMRATLLEKVKSIEKTQKDNTSDVRHVSRNATEKESIMVAGGFGESSVEIYSVKQRSWSLLESMPGGWNENEDKYSDRIHEVQLEPPYTTKLICEMPEAREGHSTELLNNNVLILGGNKTGLNKDRLSSVLLFETNKKKCQRLPGLLYPVSDMATVIWSENVVIIGGINKYGKVINSVLIYNIKTGDSHMLPPMKYGRKGCTAAVVGKNIVVMGGASEDGKILKTVEEFSFDRYTWEELPEMIEARCGATAVVI